MTRKNLALQQFSEKERKNLSEKKDGKNGQFAPDEERVGYLPIIQRGNDYSPYYKTSGFVYTLLVTAIMDILYRFRDHSFSRD